MNIIARTDQDQAPIRRLGDWLAARRRVAVLSGAGVSTASGIPDYRDAQGRWKRSAPVQFRDFVDSKAVRQRYWARSLAGWPMFVAAQPSSAHRALAELERRGIVHAIITQNVDCLHQRAGSHAVIDLHGRLDRLRCLSCGREFGRADFQQRLQAANPDWDSRAARMAPDGDADLEGVDFSRFRVPPCEACGGILKPDVVFYGELVPQAVTQAATAAVETADGLLVAGSSLMVGSSFRLLRRAVDHGISVVAVNRGHLRGAEMLDFQCEGDMGEVLNAALTHLDAGT